MGGKGLAANLHLYIDIAGICSKSRPLLQDASIRQMSAPQIPHLPNLDSIGAHIRIESDGAKSFPRKVWCCHFSVTLAAVRAPSASLASVISMIGSGGLGLLRRRHRRLHF
jgi:hypothetical protein